MFIIPSIDLSMKLSLSEVFVSNIFVTMVISNKSCCKHVLFMNLSNFISTTTRVTSVKYEKFLFYLKYKEYMCGWWFAPQFSSTTTRVTSVKYKKFLLGSFSVAKFGIAPKNVLSKFDRQIQEIDHIRNI